MGILIPLVLIFFTCLIIWRACDGFEVASEYIGRNLSEGVRGGTINAISSSLPELFTTMIALFVLNDQDGFAVGIGTTAGSALFNGMIIPAVCILAVVGTVIAGKRVNSVNVGSKVILRDGVSLILGEALLIVLLTGNQLDWWQGLTLMVFYLGYLFVMLYTMKQGVAGPEGSDVAEIKEDLLEAEGKGAPSSKTGRFFYWLSLGPLMDLESRLIKRKHRREIEAETWNGWPLLLSTTAVIGVACFFLVKACEWLGTGSAAHPSYELFGHEFSGLGMPPLFVAVIFASMATSVPDTIISLRDARDGDYDDAVANALGSNIFDICFALGFPLFLYTLIHGPITMTDDSVALTTELRVSLLILTVFGFLLYFVGRRIKENGRILIPLHRWRAVALLAIYIGYIVFVVARGAEQPWAIAVGKWLSSLVAWN